MADTVKPPKDPLDNLATQAEMQALESGATGDTGAPGADGSNEKPPISNAQAMGGAIAAGREAFCFFTKLQSPRAVLPDARIAELASLADPVLTKYGINLVDYIGDIGAEVALAVAVFAVGNDLRKAVSAEIAAIKETEAKDKPVDVVATDAS
jgi:hypothetical protein